MTLPLFLCPFLMEFNIFYRHIAFGNVSMGLRQSWTKNKLRSKTPLPHVNDELALKPETQIVHLF